MARAAKRKVAKTVAKTAARRKPTPKPKPKRKRAMATEKTDHTPPPAPKPADKEPLAGGTKGAYSATTSTVPPAELLTEQEKDVVGTGGTDVTAGVGPVSPSEHTSGPVETIEDQGIGPRTPYPSGGEPPEGGVTAKKKGPGK
jgi:hypothetical protein